MRRVIGWCAAVAAGVCLFGGGVARGAVTRVATFENYPGNMLLWTSFTDPASGIYFHDSTQRPGAGFGISHSATLFGGGNYLSAAGGEDGWSPYFGFNADPPAPARRVSVDVLCVMARQSDVGLVAYDAAGAEVGRAVGEPVYSAAPFTLSVGSTGYDIARFRVVAWGDMAYDNVTVVVPEPGAGVAAVAAGVVALGMVRRRQRANGGRSCGR